MLLTIHNLPATTRYADIKSLLQSKCGLQHVILDNLIGEGSGKKVTVGVAEDADAAILVRKINGLYWNGQQLYVEDVRQQKKASEQPFRSMNSQPSEPTDPSFRSMNLQQHSSFSNKNMGMPTNMMTPAVQPMMAAMYYVPGYPNQEYMQTMGNMQGGNFGQGQSYDQITEKVQSAYMGISGFTQTATQMSQVGMVSQFNNNQDFSQPEIQNSGWGDSYNEKEDFAAEKPLYGRRSPGTNRKPTWFPNQQKQRENPPRERSNDREQSWTAPRGSDNRGPRLVQPDFRSNRPDDHSGFKKPRLDFRQNDRPALLEQPNVRPEFGSNLKGQDQFSGRPTEFSGRLSQRQGRPNERDEFLERSREFGNPNVRQGPSEFSGRPNEFSGRPNKFSGRPNEFSERPNERERRPNEQQGRSNEFSDRKGRASDRPGTFRANDRPEFNRSNGRDEVSRSNDRFEFSRRGPNQRDTRPERDSRPIRDSRPDRGNVRSEFPNSKKRKFEETFQENAIERPLRVSRPNLRARPPAQFSKPPVSKGFSKVDEQAMPMNEVDSAKRKKQMFLAGVRRIIYEIKTNLGIQAPDLITRQMLNKFVNERLEQLLFGRELVTPIECYGVYRTRYPKSDDTAAYNSILEMVAKKKAEEAAGVKPVSEVGAPVSKPVVFRQPAPPKLTKGEIKANKMKKEAKILLSQGKVPNFPQGDKSLVAQQKREERERFIPEVDCLHKTAIEEEVNALTKMLIDELDNPHNAAAQKVYNIIERKELADDMKHDLTQCLARRVLDSGLKVVRVYASPKLPRRETIEKFLLKFGVQSLRKSVKNKMYTAAVDTYKNYDKLCNNKSVIVEDGITLSFKPFHVAPKPKADQKLLKVIRKKIVRDMIDKSDLNLLDKDWPAKDAEIKEKQALEAAAKELQLQVLEAQKIAEQAEKKSEEALKNEELINGETDLTVKNEEILQDFTSDYFNEDFHVIDEVHENDSDVELIGGDTEIVNIDEENDNSEMNVEETDGNAEVKNDDENDVKEDVDDDYDLENDIEEDIEENDVELAYKAFEKSQNASTDVDLDNVDVDIDDVDDDDLEDY